MALLGSAAPDAARQVVLSERQVRAWVARYNAGGSGALADRPGRGRKGPLTGDHEKQLAERLRARPTEADGVCTLRGEDVRQILEAEFGVVRCLQAVHYLLHRLGFEPLRPRPAHPRADPAARERFKYASRPESPRSPRGAGRGVVRVRGAVRAEGVADDRLGPGGSRPTAPKQTAYANLHVLSAVCPAAGRAAGRVAPRLNTSVVQTFLDGLSATIPGRTHVVRVWDGAGCHVAKALRVPPNLPVAGSPPYRPELSPVERLWLYLRQHHWSNRVDPDIEAGEEAAVSGWRAVCLHPD